MSKQPQKPKGDQVARSYGDNISNRAKPKKKQKQAGGEVASAKSADQSKPVPSGSTDNSKKAAGKDKAQDSTDRRTVFKSTLDNPFRVDW
jgi:hypothetical protein